jgi:hypothetical protein
MYDRQHRRQFVVLSWLVLGVWQYFKKSLAIGACYPIKATDTVLLPRLLPLHLFRSGFLNSVWVFADIQP